MAEQIEIPESLIRELIAIAGHHPDEVQRITIVPEDGLVDFELRLPIGVPELLDPWADTP